jgi:hypothetical protein
MRRIIRLEEEFTIAGVKPKLGPKLIARVVAHELAQNDLQFDKQKFMTSVFGEL